MCTLCLTTFLSNLIGYREIVQLADLVELLLYLLLNPNLNQNSVLLQSVSENHEILKNIKF